MRALVAYETGHGSTAEVAEAIAEVLRGKGAEVDVMRCRKVKEVASYDAVVVGSPIWVTKWLKPASRFLRRNEEFLSERPTAIFCTSGAAAEEKGKTEVMDSLVPKIRANAPSVQPVAIGNFAGVFSFPKYSFVIRAAIRAIAKAHGAPTKGIVDYRDWDEIRTWAAEVYDAFAERLGAQAP